MNKQQFTIDLENLFEKYDIKCGLVFGMRDEPMLCGVKHSDHPLILDAMLTLLKLPGLSITNFDTYDQNHNNTAKS